MRLTSELAYKNTRKCIFFFIAVHYEIAFRKGYAVQEFGQKAKKSSIVTYIVPMMSQMLHMQAAH